MPIDKLAWIMHNLIEKFNENPFITQQFLEEYEYALLEFTNKIATDNVLINHEKIQMDLEYTKKFAELRDECKSNADCESKTDQIFADRKALWKNKENTMKMYIDLSWNYRRFWDVMRSSIIWERQDNKRIDTVMSWM